ncbi:hypothetical protein B0H11DRAFT_1720711 [Mycena galericulata]|nr:hypothetical protein B0H11DRAFT_1720711 [Mycena galericulata]
MASPDEVLDLYDLALLLNYERASTEPRFRHAKLREVASASLPFKTVIVPVPEWTERTDPKDGFVFDIVPPQTPAERDGPDLPSNMLATPIRQSLRRLTPHQIETIYWQARGHDGCYKCIGLLQHFFDLYPLDVQVRVRTSAGVEFVTPALSRKIIEMELRDPKLMTLACVLPDMYTYTTGEDDSMIHAVWEFSDLSSDTSTAILDLSSVQFGDAGRGLAGRSTFVLESKDAFFERLKGIAGQTQVTKVSDRIRGTPVDAWLKSVAKRVKERWENRHEHPWCGHCGALGADLKKCSKCHKAAYCNATHQVAAWPFHKKFCS